VISPSLRHLYPTTYNTHKRQETLAPGGIQTHNPNKRAATDLRVRMRGHWDWRVLVTSRNILRGTVKRNCAAVDTRHVE